MAALATFPAPIESWAPEATDLTGLDEPGRALVGSLLARFEFTATEGAIVIEAGHVTDRLAALWRAGDPSPRIEMSWIRLLAGLLAQLRVGDGA